jgi:hypothetical protein
MQKERSFMLIAPKRQIPGQANTSQEVADLIERDPRVREKDGFFEFWYRLTAPPKQPLSANFDVREIARQGRLTSTVLAIVAGSLIILAIPTSFAINNPSLLVVLCVLLTIVGIALFLNRLGKGLAGRILVVTAMNISLAISIVIWPGGLTTNTLPVFDILVVEPTLVALALLPPASVFIVALFNVVFIILDFRLQTHSQDLIKVMSTDGYEVITRPLYLLLFVIGVVYPVMRSVLRAIVLGDRAKEIAKVQHDLASREALVVQEKQQLDRGIEQLVEALKLMTNGQAPSQLPLPSSPSLWPIAGAVNNLQARIRRASQYERELQHTRMAAAALIRAIRTHQKHQPLQIGRTGNPIIDAIALELIRDQTFTHPLP